MRQRRAQQALPTMRFACATLVMLGSCAGVPRFDGPMTVRNQHPAQLTVQRLLPGSAEPLPEGRATLQWSNAYTSYFLAGADARGSFEMDGELLRTAASARVGLGAGLELGVELPLLHGSGGFLDGFIRDWHDTFGFPDGDRANVADDEFTIAATRDGSTVFTVEPHGLHLGDVPLMISFSPLVPTNDGAFGLAILAGLELPTGDADRGFGNGGVDWSLGLRGEWRSGPVAWTAQVAHTAAASPSRARQAAFEFRDVSSFDLGAEFALGVDTTVLVQSQYETSTLRDLGFARAADDQWLIWFGLRQRLGASSRLELGFGEDLSSYVAPDFTAWVAWSFDVGPARAFAP